MGEGTIAELTRRLEEARREAAYYRRLSKECGDRRLREAEELSSLIARLRQVEKELEKARDELEQRVQERTAELRKTNERLVKEMDERHKIEQELRQTNELLGNSEERYRLLIENAEFPVLVTALTDARVLFINERAALFFGLPAREAVGEYAPDYWVYPETRERFIAELVKHGRVTGFEALLVTRNGEQRWVLISANLIEYIDKQASFIVFSDITERKRMEEELRASKEELNKYFMNSLDLLCIADTDGYFHRLNPEWQRTLGYTLSELEGKRFLDFVHPDDVETTLKAMAELAAAKEVLNFVNRYRCRDGSYRWIEWRSYPVGKTIYAVARDITERKRAEEERLQLERRLLDAQKLESLGIMAGGIAHDFNNLLAVIVGNLDLVLLRLPQVSAVRVRLEQALEATRRAVDLTGQMLAYIGMGRFVVTRVDLSGLVREKADLFRAVVARTSTLNLHPSPEPLFTEADSGQVQQVIMNLITNASEAMEEKPGTVTVTTGVEECDEAYLSRSRLEGKPPAGRFVYVEVADTGCGMDEQTQQRLFDPFFTTKFVGRGLGMSAVLGIVRGHKGAIIVESAAEVGSSIRVLFPAFREESGTAEEVPGELPPASGTRAHCRTVLVVDDEEAVREVGSAFLETIGFQAITAADGEEALLLFKQHANELACVLLDLTMPRMDGVSTFREMRRLRTDVPVILCSGYTEEDATQRFTSQGLAGFIQKPYRMQNLKEELARVLQSFGKTKPKDRTE